MKAETQHLDYLISQYVDGCLDPASKKSVEQQMLNSPPARQLYKEHRDTQDLLDDWGNRIPMIDWADFDKKLALRLEKEDVGAQRMAAWRRWTKPLAAAAALLLAAGIGYMGHGPSVNNATRAGGVQAVAVVQPRTQVTIEDGATSTGPSSAEVRFVESGLQSSPVGGGEHLASISPPGDSAAVQSLKEAVSYGLRQVDSLDSALGGGPVAIEVTIPKKTEKDPPLP